MEGARGLQHNPNNEVFNLSWPEKCFCLFWSLQPVTGPGPELSGAALGAAVPGHQGRDYPRDPLISVPHSLPAAPGLFWVYSIPMGMYLMQQGFLSGMAIIVYSVIPLCRGVGFCHAGNKGFAPGFFSGCCMV